MLTIYRDLGTRLDFTQGLGCADFYTPSLNQAPFPLQIERGGECMQPSIVRVAVWPDGGRTSQEVSTPGTTVSVGCTDDYTDHLPPQAPNHICGPTHYSLYDHNVLSAATGTTQGELLTAWWDSEGDAGEGASRISVSLSLDNGQHWRTTTAIGAAGHPEHMQHRPAIAIAPNGRLDVVYYDLAADGSQEVDAVTAPNARRELSAPVRISRSPANTAVGPMSDDNRASFGDHLAAVSSNDATYVAWTGTRGSHPVIDFARAPAVLGSTTASRGWSIGVIAGIAVAVLAVVGAGGAVWLRRVRLTQSQSAAATLVGSREDSPR